MEIIAAPCSGCMRKTNHYVLHKVEKSDDFFGPDVFLLIECAGCERVSMANFWGEDVKGERYYPSPVNRREPDWVFELYGEGGGSRNQIPGLLNEIYEALRGGQKRLAGMGIRALLETVMVDLVGDHGTFAENLNKFQEAGYVSARQRAHIEPILDVGHAAMHRAFVPEDSELNAAMDIAEGILASIFIHPESASKIAGRVPPRPPRLKPAKLDGANDEPK